MRKPTRRPYVSEFRRQQRADRIAVVLASIVGGAFAIALAVAFTTTANGL